MNTNPTRFFLSSIQFNSLNQSIHPSIHSSIHPCPASPTCFTNLQWDDFFFLSAEGWDVELVAGLIFLSFHDFVWWHFFGWKSPNNWGTYRIPQNFFTFDLNKNSLKCLRMFVGCLQMFVGMSGSHVGRSTFDGEHLFFPRFFGCFAKQKHLERSMVLHFIYPWGPWNRKLVQWPLSIRAVRQTWNVWKAEWHPKHEVNFLNASLILKRHLICELGNGTLSKWVSHIYIKHVYYKMYIYMYIDYILVVYGLYINCISIIY